MLKKELLYEGKAKKVFTTEDADNYIVVFKDEVTALNGRKKGLISNKGVLNAKISTIFFTLLEKMGIKTHFLKQISSNELLVRKLTIIPLEVVIRNIAAGSLVKRLGFKEGTHLKKPLLEFYYKDDRLGDPMINSYHIAVLELAAEEELAKITETSFRINNILLTYLKDKGIELVDFKLEFGRTAAGDVLLADELSPDTCRFWDSISKDKLDKDRFRQDLGEVASAYQEILRRLERDED